MPELEEFHAIKWDDSMASGIASIDKQHQYLIDTLDDANQRLLAENDTAHLRLVINQLLGYAIMHFETEEELMQRYGYITACPEEAEKHIAQHRDFSSWVVGVQEQLRQGRKISRLEILKFLNHWLRNHVLGTDRLLCNYLNEKMK
jgi:hemerythrin-like metal-binding protein